MIVIGLISLCVNLSDCNRKYNTFLFLCLSTLGIFCSVVMHSPFIAIAYLNDAYHAGSIFVYYTIIILVLFALVEQLIVSCQKKIIDVYHNYDKEIQLKGTWTLKKEPVHIIDHKRKERELELQNGTLEISNGKIQVDFEKIESEITLEIESGTLQFTLARVMTHFHHVHKNKQSLWM